MSQATAAKAVGRANQVAVEAERWIKESPQVEVETVVGDDARIRRLVGRDFPGMGLIDSVLLKAGQVTGDDILLRYGRKRSVDRRLEPLDAESLRRHFTRLGYQAGAMREQLQVPKPMAIFSPDTCGMVISSQISGVIPWSGPQWGSCFGTPLEWRQSTDEDEISVQVKLPLELNDTFRNLRNHLSAEFPTIIDAFEEWREMMGRWLQLCLDQIHWAVAICSERTGLVARIRCGCIRPPLPMSASSFWTTRTRYPNPSLTGSTGMTNGVWYHRICPPGGWCRVRRIPWTKPPRS